jgi:catechol 2,3-dioxygenase-like lactoylglutathione lyase family enzyme
MPRVSAKLKHIAFVSDRYTLQARYYEAAFGMRNAADPRPERALTVSDGYVSLEIDPRKPGRPAGFDHFGLEVDDVLAVVARLRDKYPAVQVVKRPGTPPFAGISTHDPAGNVFDLSQPDGSTRVDAGHPRRMSHLALRTLHAGAVAEFYAEVFGLKYEKREDANFYLSDGSVTLVIMPWRITDYEGTGIVRPGPDHIGFHVESLSALKERLQKLGDDNPQLRAQPLTGREGEARLKLFAACCPLGEYRLADVDGVLLDVAETKR